MSAASVTPAAAAKRGADLVFILSRPRSGTSLLQHLLGAHSQILTFPEPWMMLHLCSGLRQKGVWADYNADFVRINTARFIETLPGSYETYWEALALAAERLYQGALAADPVKRFVVDKSNRYYFIIPELMQVFPDARFVFLFRNPLATWCSFLDVNLKGDYANLLESGWRHDMATAPRLLVEGVRRMGDRACIVNYEQLVEQPAEELARLCAYIGVPFEPAMTSYRDATRMEWGVDPVNIYKHNRPVTDYRDRWRERLDTPLKRELARQYLETLGRQVIEAMGYSFDELCGIVGMQRHVRDWTPAARWPLFSADYPCWGRYQRGHFRIAQSLRRRGMLPGRL